MSFASTAGSARSTCASKPNSLSEGSGGGYSPAVFVFRLKFAAIPGEVTARAADFAGVAEGRCAAGGTFGGKAVVRERGERRLVGDDPSFAWLLTFGLGWLGWHGFA